MASDCLCSQVRPLANVLLDDEATLGWTLAERALAVFINYPLPPWVGHVLSSVVLHQDAGLLYGQSRTLRAKGYNFARRSALGDGRIGSSSGGGGGSSGGNSDFVGESSSGGSSGSSSGSNGGNIGGGDDGLSDSSKLGSLSEDPSKLGSLSEGPHKLGSLSEGPSKLGSHSGVRMQYDQLAFCPTSSDKGVVSFRQWLRRHGGGGIPWACDDVLPPLGSEDIYDMWHAHTKHCSQCQAALRQLERAKYAAGAVVGASIVWVPQGAPERTTAILGAAAVAAAAHAISRLFYRYEYSHADEYGPLDWWLDATGKGRR